MKKVKTVTIEQLHRGIALIFETDQGPVAVEMKKNDARELMRRIFRVLGAKRGDGGLEEAEMLSED